MLLAVKDFVRDQPGSVKQELNGIIWKLETEGALSMPYGEKLDGENLFAIRAYRYKKGWIEGRDRAFDGLTGRWPSSAEKW